MSKAPSSAEASAAELAPDPAPSHPVELELKLALQRSELALLRARLDALCVPAQASPLRIDSRYYDTNDRLLARHRMAIRVRRIGRRTLQTLKTQGESSALSRRGEWELPAPGGKLQLAAFADTPLSGLLAGHPQAQLKPIHRTRFIRHLWRSTAGDIEIALDDGEIAARRRHAPLLELELESKGAAPEALWGLAARLQQAQPDGAPALVLLPLAESKAERGDRLSRRQPPEPVKGNAQALCAELAPQLSADAALRIVMARGIEVVLANGHGLLQHEEAEFVHQARVALRRMRSAERLLRKWVRFPSELRDELRWAARALGNARDADVFALETLPSVTKGFDGATRRRLLAAARQRRASARDTVHQDLQSARFAALSLAISRWATAPAARGKALQSLAARCLRRGWERLLAAAQFFGALSMEEQHRVRILAKRLRYALDLFAACLPRERAATWTECLAQLQDVLGEMNDLASAESAFTDLEAAPPAALQRRWYARREVLARTAEQQLLKLARMRTAWD